VLTPDFPPAYGGIQLVMDRLVRNWHRVRPRVVTLAPRDQPRGSRASSVVVRIPQPSWLGHPTAVGLLNAAALVEALRFRPDVILSGHVNVSPAALAMSRIRRVPFVQYLHGREAVIRPRLTRKALGASAAVIAVSGYSAALANRFGAEQARVHRIPPGVDLVEKGGSSGSERPTIVSVSRLEERYKGHDVLIRALPLVRARVPGARLVLVGDGQLRESYTSLAAALGLDGNVEFAGAVSDDVRNRILASGHVFAMPSRLPPDGGGEGFGIVYLEAGLYELPVVAGNVAGAVDAVLDGETGLLVDPVHHVAVADAISRLLLDPELAATLGRAGARRAREHALPLIARRVEDLVLEVAG
jgi:phosphatidyl-myo-inositol dimannoside synthase